jgi:hypothetical protein
MDGADVNAADGYDEAPLFCAASRGHKKAGSFHGTALHGAAENGHLELVSLLLEKGADINAEDAEQETALDRAV